MPAVASNAHGLSRTARADAEAKCKVTATSSNGGAIGMTGCFADGGSIVAKADGGEAGGSAVAACSVKATSKGNGAEAIGDCQNSCSKIVVTAPAGGTAIGSDFNPPVCAGGGHVKSPMGNC